MEKMKQFHKFSKWCGMILVMEIDRRMSTGAVFLLLPGNLKGRKNHPIPSVKDNFWNFEFPLIRLTVFPSIPLRGDFCALVRRNGIPLQEFMRFESMRIQSFNGVSVAVSALVLAQDGFFATKDDDETRCFSCGIRHRNWRRGDKPADFHAEDCSRHNAWNISFEENALPTESDIQSQSQIAFPHDHDIHPPPQSVSCQENIAESQHTNTNVHRYHNLRERLQRYHHLNCHHDIQNPLLEELPNAGCYCLGTSDRVRCFACGVILSDWEPGDNPYEEHVRSSPRCEFVTSVRRQRYYIHITASIASQTIHERQNGILTDRRGVELLEVFYRCLEMGFSQQEISSAALNVLEQGGYCGRGPCTMPPMLLLPALLEERGPASFFADKGLCQVCSNETVNTIFLPCCHAVSCDTCARNIGACPLTACGSRVQHYICP